MGAAFWIQDKRMDEDRPVTPLQSAQISVRAPAGPGQLGQHCRVWTITHVQTSAALAAVFHASLMLRAKPAPGELHQLDANTRKFHQSLMPKRLH